MALRNFWLEAKIDGRESRPAGGPLRKDGGMEVTVLQRDEGTKATAVKVVCRAIGDKLRTEGYLYGGADPVAEFETRR